MAGAGLLRVVVIHSTRLLQAPEKTNDFKYSYLYAAAAFQQPVPLTMRRINLLPPINFRPTLPISHLLSKIKKGRKCRQIKWQSIILAQQVISTGFFEGIDHYKPVGLLDKYLDRSA
jgi:hypothetical protein